MVKHSYTHDDGFVAMITGNTHYIAEYHSVTILSLMIHIGSRDLAGTWKVPERMPTYANTNRLEAGKSMGMEWIWGNFAMNHD